MIKIPSFADYKNNFICISSGKSTEIVLEAEKKHLKLFVKAYYAMMKEESVQSIIKEIQGKVYKLHDRFTVCYLLFFQRILKENNIFPN